MKKLKIDELATSESLTLEEKKALLGGVKGTFSPDLVKPGTGENKRRFRERFDKVRKVRVPTHIDD